MTACLYAEQAGAERTGDRFNVHAICTDLVRWAQRKILAEYVDRISLKPIELPIVVVGCRTIVSAPVPVGWSAIRK
jgi:hypothetical protein